MNGYPQSISFFSPAKINLFLRILAKRPDGYHSLATLIQAITLGDTVYIEKAPASLSRDQLTCTDPRLPCDGSNLALRAAELFRAKSSIPVYVTIHIEKHIPIEAGLGGGSSNAATVLWAMNQLVDAPFSSAKLQEWSSLLGSDVPFFFASGVAYCTGRGEIVHPTKPLALPSIWIIKPPQGLSTRTVYGALEPERLPERDPDVSLAVFESMKEHFPLYNDLEATALRLDPELRLLNETLRLQYGNQVLLSGSGSSFFCLGQQAPHFGEHDRWQQCRVFQAKPLYKKENAWYTI